MSKRVWIKLIPLLVVVVLVVILILQNSEPQRVKILFLASREVSLALMLAITFLLGFVAGLIALLRLGARRRG